MDLAEVGQMLDAVLTQLDKINKHLLDEGALRDTLAVANKGLDDMRKLGAVDVTGEHSVEAMEKWYAEIVKLRDVVWGAAAVAKIQATAINGMLDSAMANLARVSDGIKKLEDAVEELSEAKSIITSLTPAADRMLPIIAETCSFRVGKAITHINEVRGMLPR